MTEILKAAARASGKIISEHFQTAVRTETQEKTSHRDLVTHTDEESQETIRTQIRQKLSETGIPPTEIGFIGEEKLNENGNQLFIIDPIDGTTNFACGLPFFCVSIGYANEGQLKGGVIFEPITGTMFWGEKGKGSFVERNGVTRKLEIKLTDLKNSFASAHANTPGAWKKTAAMHPKVRGIRNLGSVTLELAYLAEGTFNIVYCSRCYIWDLAAAAVIIAEAGGQIAEMDGKKWQPDWTDNRKPLEIVAGRAENIPEIIGSLELLE